jgi:hypothetical protein
VRAPPAPPRTPRPAPPAPLTSTRTGFLGRPVRLRGNVNYMKARQGLVACKGLGISAEEVPALLPIIEEGLSDSGAFNSAVELLIANGRPLPDAVRAARPRTPAPPAACAWDTELGSAVAWLLGR